MVLAGSSEAPLLFIKMETLLGAKHIVYAAQSAALSAII